MLKSIRKNTVVPSFGKRIKVSYNDGKCFQCNSSEKLIPITNDETSSVSFCSTCNIKVVLQEYIDEEEYKKKIEYNLMVSRLYNPSSVKKENFRTI